MSWMQRPEDETAFTLVEVMIVVAIVAVLAMIAVVGYSRHIKGTRILEAEEMLGKIHTRQQAYYEDNGYYCHVSTAYHPALGGAFEPKPWNPPVEWVPLSLKVDRGTTYFSYVVVAGVPNADPAQAFALTGDAGALGIPDSKQPWYYARARADMDGDASNFTDLSINSFRSKVIVRDRGK